MTKPRRMHAAALFMAAVAAVAFPIASAPAQAVAPSACKGNPSDTFVNVTVEGLRSGSGLVAVTLYPDNPRRFLAKKGSLKVARVDATAPVTRMCMFVPGPGTYAIAVYHDEDGSRKLNRSGLGLPKEGFGFSNNPPTFAGLPPFKKVRLKVAQSGMTTNIKLKYP